MKILYTILSAIFCYSAIAQIIPEHRSFKNETNSDLKVDDVQDPTLYTEYFLGYSWNTQTQDWDLVYKGESEYTENDKIILYTGLKWDATAGIWVNDVRELYKYAGGKKTSEFESSIWDVNSSVWMPNLKTVYTYDSFWNKTSELFYSWDNTNQIWNANSKEEYTYKGEGLLTSWKSSSIVGGEWDVIKLETYELNEHGDILSSEYLEKNSSTGKLINVNKNVYTYLSNSLLETWNGAVWDASSNDWLNTYKTEYEYDEGGNPSLFSTFEYYSISDTFELISKKEFIYMDSLMLSEDSYTWDVSSKTWNRSYSYNFRYNDSGMKISETEFGWDTTLNKWLGFRNVETEYDVDLKPLNSLYYTYNVNSEKWDTSYIARNYVLTVPTVTFISQNNESQILISPNPASNSVEIVTQSEDSQVLSIYNSLGHTVFETKFRSQVNVDVSFWTSGVYYYGVKSLESYNHGCFIKQ